MDRGAMMLSRIEESMQHQQAILQQQKLNQLQQQTMIYSIAGCNPALLSASSLSISEMVRIQQEDALAMQRERYTPSEMRIRRCKAENVTAVNSELMGKSIDSLLDAMDIREAWKEVNDIAPGWIDPSS